MKTTHELATTGSSGNTRHSRTQWFKAYSVISPAIRFLTPSLADLRQLDAAAEASGPHDFAVRKLCSRQSHLSRPPHPAPYAPDDRGTPLVSGRGRQFYKPEF